MAQARMLRIAEDYERLAEGDWGSAEINWAQRQSALGLSRQSNMTCSHGRVPHR